jgi:protein O-GlcNAc transferase
VSIKIKPRKGGASGQELAAQAIAHHRQGNFGVAERIYRSIVAGQPENFAALHLLGMLLHQRGKAEAAVPFLERAIRLKADDAEMHSNLGVALSEAKRFEEAVASYHRALALEPNLAGVHSNLGVALAALKRFDEAIASYRRALELAPENAEALNNLGLALLDIGNAEEAARSFRTALAVRPEWSVALVNLGNALTALKLYPDAIQAFDAALKHDPEHGYARALRLFLKRQICDWSDHDEERRITAEKGGGWRKDRDLPSPFMILPLTDDPRVQLECARAYAAQYEVASSSFRPGAPRRAGRDKIRLAYLSPDFRQHATSILLADLIEAHDRDRFEVTAISYGPDDGSAMRRRMAEAFDRFVDVRTMSDGEAARGMRELEIDIAVDLSGYTTHARTRILAQRPAPIQVGYLAYPGTTGSAWIDYLITDRFLTPPDLQPFFTEKFAVLPDCFQVNSFREPAERTPAREECGLPPAGFVFCSFNNSYKIAPELFAIWMRLLQHVPGSVLWLLGENAWASENLRREAAQLGIDPARVVLAPRAPYAEHLGRHRHADLFLDTLPYNAATTASDALWAGVPLLTCPGRSFVSRIAGSLLSTVPLPELIAPSLEEYERRALHLASHPAELRSLRHKLAEHKAERLFNPRRFRQHIEAAYARMWESWRRGERPRSFAIEAVPD